ncbi:hypothetical protein PAMP_008378 [Pampus punctatissimus]
MTELRCRKTETLEGDKEENERQDELTQTTHDKQQNDEGGKEEDAQHKEEGSNKNQTSVKRSKSSSTSGFLQRLVRVFFGCLAAVACGMLHAGYLSAYHDRKFWFSTRQDFVEPIYFYIGAVFGLQVVYITALFVCSWVMSGTWMAGMLAVAWYVINRTDTSKVDHDIPLRDNWALPYFSCQVAALTGFLSNNISSATEMFCYLTMSATTFTFLLVWEHSHYVLFLQGLCLFLLDSFDLVPTRKMADIQKVYLSSLFLVYVFQFQNATLLSSPLLSLLIGSVLARYFQQKMKMGPLVARVMKLFLHFHLVFTTGITFSYLVKKLIPVSENDFILKFLEVKFGLNTTT